MSTDKDNKTDISSKYVEYEIPSIKWKEKKVHFIDDRLVAALDACKISDPQAMHIVTSVAVALGHDPKDLVLSRSTIQRCRSEYRKRFTSIQK